jgi:hypothetical protein
MEVSSVVRKISRKIIKQKNHKKLIEKTKLKKKTELNN